MIARARNLSQSVEATAFANLAGRFELMKEVLRSGSPAMQALEKRVVWKTNQEVSEDGKAIAAKTLISLLAMMDIHKYPVDKRPAHAVFGHAAVVVRDFAEAEGAEREFQDSMTRLLPKFLELYDEVYSILPETDPNFPWADGKFDPDRTMAYHGDKRAVQHIGKDKEIWLRLESDVMGELRHRERLANR
jgi:hypothetical protein